TARCPLTRTLHTSLATPPASGAMRATSSPHCSSASHPTGHLMVSNPSGERFVSAAARSAVSLNADVRSSSSLRGRTPVMSCEARRRQRDGLVRQKSSRMARNHRSLLDDLIGARQKGRRELQADGLGDASVHDELEPSWLLNRQVSGPSPAE